MAREESGGIASRRVIQPLPPREEETPWSIAFLDAMGRGAREAVERNKDEPLWTKRAVGTAFDLISVPWAKTVKPAMGVFPEIAEQSPTFRKQVYEPMFEQSIIKNWLEAAARSGARKGATVPRGMEERIAYESLGPKGFAERMANPEYDQETIDLINVISGLPEKVFLKPLQMGKISATADWDKIKGEGLDYKKAWETGEEGFEKLPIDWQLTAGLADPLNIVDFGTSMLRSTGKIGREARVLTKYVKPLEELSTAERLRLGAPLKKDSFFAKLGTRVMEGAEATPEQLGLSPGKKNIGSLWRLTDNAKAIEAKVDAIDTIFSRGDMLKAQTPEEVASVIKKFVAEERTGSFAGQRSAHLAAGLPERLDAANAMFREGLEKVWKPLADKAGGMDRVDDLLRDIDMKRVTDPELLKLRKAAASLPRNEEEAKIAAQVISKEHLGQAAQTFFDVKPMKGINKLLNTIKSVQSFIFLSTNPRYLLNNIFDNERASLLYVGGYGVPNVDEWIKEFGYTPERLSQGITISGLTPKSEYGRGVSGGVEKALDWFNKTPASVTKWAQQAESAQSKKAFAAGMNKAWTWNAGQFLPEMDKALAGALGPKRASQLRGMVLSNYSHDNLVKEIQRVAGGQRRTVGQIVDGLVAEGTLGPEMREIISEPKYTELAKKLIDNAKDPSAGIDEFLRYVSKDLAQAKSVPLELSDGPQAVLEAWLRHDLDMGRVFEWRDKLLREVFDGDTTMEAARYLINSRYDELVNNLTTYYKQLEKRGFDVKSLLPDPQALSDELKQVWKADKKITDDFFATQNKEAYRAAKTELWDGWFANRNAINDGSERAVLEHITGNNPNAAQEIERIIELRGQARAADRQILDEAFMQADKAADPAQRRQIFNQANARRQAVWGNLRKEERDALNGLVAKYGGSPTEIASTIPSPPGTPDEFKNVWADIAKLYNKGNEKQAIAQADKLVTKTLKDNIGKPPEEVLDALKKKRDSLATRLGRSTPADVGREAYEAQARLDAIETALQDEYGGKFQRIVAKHWGGKEGGLKRVRGTTTNKLQAADIADYNGYVAQPEQYPWMARRINAGMKPADAMEDAIREFKSLQAEKRALKTQLANAPKITAPKTITTGVAPTPAPSVARGFVDVADLVPDNAAVNDEYYRQLEEIMGAVRGELLADDFGTWINDLPKEGVDQLVDYIKGLKPAYDDARIATVKLGELWRDMALLNYTRRYGYQSAIEAFLPYQFWYTTSIAHYARKAMDQPGLAAIYYRTKRELNDLQYGPNFPSRLQGMVRLPMPFMPEWAGDVYVDPLSMVAPIESFGYGFKSLSWKTEREQLEEQLTRLQEHGGTEEQIAEVKQALENSPDRDIYDYASLLVSPSLPIQILVKNIIQGEPIRPLFPGSRFVKGMTALAGHPVDLEAEGRRLLNERFGTHLAPQDEYTNYQIERMVVNMESDGEISNDEAQRAIVEQSGPVWEKAKERAAFEMGVKSPVPFRVSIYPTGEQKIRALQKEYSQLGPFGTGGASKEEKAEFYKAHPEYGTRSMIFDLPGEQFRAYLTDKIYDLPDLTRKQLSQTYPEEMERFYNKQATSADLAKIADAVGIEVPSLPKAEPGEDRALFEGKPEFEPGPKISTTPAQATGYDEYRKEAERQFGSSIWKLLEDYVDAKKTNTQGMILQMHPVLEQYFNFQDEYIKRNPYVADVAFPAKTDSERAVRDWERKAAQEFGYDIKRLQSRYFELPEAERPKFLADNPRLKKYWSARDDFRKEQPQATEEVWGKEKESDIEQTMTDEQEAVLDRFYEQMDKKYPGVQERLSAYYRIKDMMGDDAARAYWKKYPEMQGYLDAKKDFKKLYPDVAIRAWPQEEVDEQQQIWYDYLDEVIVRFGSDIYDKQAEYYSTENKAVRKQILAKYPELKKYWDFGREWSATYPAVAKRFKNQKETKQTTSEQPAQVVQLTGLDDREKTELDQFFKGGIMPSPATIKKLGEMYRKNPAGKLSFRDWLNALMEKSQ